MAIWLIPRASRADRRESVGENGGRVGEQERPTDPLHERKRMSSECRELPWPRTK